MSVFELSAIRICALLLSVILSPLLPLSSASGALVLNEILYDPDGADTGREWVELYNTGAWPAPLDGVSLESGNGSAPDQWSEVWRGESGEWIEPGGYFWIGGPFEGRLPDSEASVGLQNGPDGVRLLREGLEIDRVGWGDLVDPEYFEGSPAVRVSSGMSLARRPDGVDTDHNDLDLFAQQPTPGRANWPDRDLSIRIWRPGRPLPVPEGTGEIEARLLLENHGRLTIGLGELSIRIDGRPLTPPAFDSMDLLSPGGSIDGSIWLPLGGRSGASVWKVTLTLLGDEESSNDLDSLSLWVGESGVRFAEILPKPEIDESEWIELEVIGAPTVLDGWSIRDAGGGRLTIETATLFGRQSRPVVAAARDRVFDLPEDLALEWAGGWPSLNDHAPDGEAADSLFLYDPKGMVRDWAAYPSSIRGVSWVRVGAASGSNSGMLGWSLSEPELPTPGRPPRIAPVAEPPGPGDSPAPPAISLEQAPSGAWIRLDRSLFPGSFRVRIFDLDGRSVFEEAGEQFDRIDRWTRWEGKTRDGRPLDEGVYLVDIESIDRQGHRRQEHLPVVLGR